MKKVVIFQKTVPDYRNWLFEINCKVVSKINFKDLFVSNITYVIPRELKYAHLMILIYLSKPNLYVWGHEYSPFSSNILKRKILSLVSSLACRNAYYFPVKKNNAYILFNSKEVCPYGDLNNIDFDSPIHFIYIGRIYKEKGLKEILNFFKENQDYSLDIVGPDNPKTILPNVNYLGEIRDLSILPKGKYRFAISGGALGLNILDYFALGCPIIRLNDLNNGPEQWYLDKLNPAHIAMVKEEYIKLVKDQYNILKEYSIDSMVSNFKSFCFD